MYSALEGTVLVVACMMMGDSTHLTWWAALLLAVYDLLSALFPECSELLVRVWTLVRRCRPWCNWRWF